MTEKKDSKVNIGVTLDKVLFEEIKKEARNRKISISALVTERIKAFYEEVDKSESEELKDEE